MKNKTRKFILLLSALLIVFALINSCKGTLVDPSENLEPGRRDYTWTVDTITVPPSDNFNVWGIWGSSPEDVWISGDASPAKYGLWHYDGKEWKHKAPELGMWGLTDIYGFASDDVWMVSSAGMIWHFDGNAWTKFGEYSVPGYDRLLFERIWGASPNDIYAVGFADDIYGPDYKGIIMHYNGNDWSFYDSTNFYKSNIVNIGVQKSTGTILVSAVNDDNIGRDHMLFSITNKRITELYVGKFWVDVYTINGEVYIDKNISPTQANIYKFSNGRLIPWHNFQGTDFASLLGGYNEKDIFTYNWGTTEQLPGIGHFNGENLIKIFQISADITDNVLLENNVFFAFRDFYSSSSIIVHGELK